MVAPHGLGYLGQALSSAELMATLFTSDYHPGKDELVCSPGHYMIAIYAAAYEHGLLTRSDLDSYGEDGSKVDAIGTEGSPGVDLTSGSLGQGLSGAVGLAMAHRLRGRDDVHVYCLVSDGELEEGQLWEAVMFAGHHDLTSLTVLLDANDSQVDGPVSSITTIEPIAAKFESFGWSAYDVDGHSTADLDPALTSARSDGSPSVVIARTSTRQGVASLPEGADGHFIKLPPELAAEVLAELRGRSA